MKNTLPSLKPTIFMFLAAAIGVFLYLKRENRAGFDLHYRRVEHAEDPSFLKSNKAELKSQNIGEKFINFAMLGRSVKTDDFKELEKLTQNPDVQIKSSAIAAMGLVDSPAHRLWLDSFLARKDLSSGDRANALQAKIKIMNSDEAQKFMRDTLTATSPKDLFLVSESLKLLRRFCPNDRYDLLENLVKINSDSKVLAAAATELTYYPSRRSLDILKSIEKKSNFSARLAAQFEGQLKNPENSDPCSQGKGK